MSAVRNPQEKVHQTQIVCPSSASNVQPVAAEQSRQRGMPREADWTFRARRVAAELRMGPQRPPNAFLEGAPGPSFTQMSVRLRQLSL